MGDDMRGKSKEERLLLEKNEEIRKQQSYWVVKQNDLIQHSRYSLTLSQQRLLLFLISKITPYDDVYNEYRVKIKEIIDVCEYEKSGGVYYNLIKRDLLALRNSAIWVETDDYTIETLGWLIKAKFTRPKKGVDFQEVIFSFEKGLEPVLFQLHGFYTQYTLDNILTLKHKYSIRLYEYLMSYANMMYVIVSIEDLKARLDAQRYSKYSHFKGRVLLPSIEDINSSKTNIYVRYDELKTGKTITSIAFYIWGVNEDSKDYTIEDMRIHAGTMANIERRINRQKKREIDKNKIIQANKEIEITAQTSMFDND